MTKIFGHRGAAGTYPENTMASFQAAIEAGADGIELDVQMTRDGELVVIHDESVERTTNSTGFIKDFLYRDLQAVDACYKFKQFKGKTKIPTLDEVFSWAEHSGGFLVNVELKNTLFPYEGIEEKVIQLIYRYNLSERVIISSFNHYSLVKCHQITKDIEKAILYMEGLYEPWNYAKTVGALSLHPKYTSAPPHSVTLAQNNGIEVRPFTINKVEVMKQYISCGCGGIITDYPEKAVKILSKYN
ncbi:glycerophosphodiester phosphodiesterase [Metabacillus arenae]|uniref:Glycerophosphodiester phosphodiesterase n=1 Tax=Metabacillus arenae TaxID=2771434 RepID=A0A926NDD0_9BACI|nr:glycerophosphodiester phosphodiesterase [Metabacillus arenae]MBD1378780.1 glycerophosphodiester phosphodiesterase [Metabacillus arenae]